MGISVLVLYPKTEDSKFDMDYYKTSHMPMVAEEFSSYGFNGKQTRVPCLSAFSQLAVYLSVYLIFLLTLHYTLHTVLSSPISLKPSI